MDSEADQLVGLSGRLDALGHYGETSGEGDPGDRLDHRLIDEICRKFRHEGPVDLDLVNDVIEPLQMRHGGLAGSEVVESQTHTLLGDLFEDRQRAGEMFGDQVLADLETELVSRKLRPF